jgi:quercetin dioxygenase-like cupin family protein
LRNFLKIAEGVDVMPLLSALARSPELWNQNLLRTTHQSSPHTQVDDIWLRFNDLKTYEETADPAHVMDQHESINYPAFYALPQARALIFALMARVEGERLGRCIITKLKPGAVIDPHVDSGDHAAYFERYHIVLQSLPGSVFHAGGETVQMRVGEVWWFDNSSMHSVINNSADDRIHLIVDIKACK